MLGPYLTVQLLVQLADPLCQLGQLLSNDCMMNSLGCVRLHIKVIGHKIRVALCKHNSTSSNHHLHFMYEKKACGGKQKTLFVFGRVSVWSVYIETTPYSNNHTITHHIHTPHCKKYHLLYEFLVFRM